VDIRKFDLMGEKVNEGEGFRPLNLDGPAEFEFDLELRSLFCEAERRLLERFVQETTREPVPPIA